MDLFDVFELESFSFMLGILFLDFILQDIEVFCNELLVIFFVKFYIFLVQLVENIGFELMYVLLVEMVREGCFQDLFEELDKNLDKLYIGSYGVLDINMQFVQVFIQFFKQVLEVFFFGYFSWQYIC